MADHKGKRTDRRGWREALRARWRRRKPVRSSDVVVCMALAALATVFLARSAARLFDLG
jgi:hypothetical protein